MGESIPEDEVQIESKQSTKSQVVDVFLIFITFSDSHSQCFFFAFLYLCVLIYLLNLCTYLFVYLKFLQVFFAEEAEASSGDPSQQQPKGQMQGEVSPVITQGGNITNVTSKFSINKYLILILL